MERDEMSRHASDLNFSIAFDENQRVEPNTGQYSAKE